MNKAYIFTGMAALFFCNQASADLIYKPIDPSFGGDPFNSSHLMGLANSQNQFNKPKSSTTQTNTERFLSMLESRLYSALASQVANAIFGDNAQPSGTILFDDQQVSFLNTGTEIQLTVTDFSTGKITNIVIPTLTP
ncbi:MAG: curli assembly protein CsgF [Rhodomicrobiaceae bacterium]